jgi:sulfur-oxidizing protein SoxX
MQKLILPLTVAFAVIATAASYAATTDVHDANLIPYSIVDGGIPAPLGGLRGDANAGRQIVQNRKLGNCLSCHSMPLAAPDQGNVGPALAHVGSAFSVAQLRLRIVNPKEIDPQTIMPAYYRVDGLRHVATAFLGKPILTAQQVEDVVAYLASLK